MDVCLRQSSATTKKANWNVYLDVGDIKLGEEGHNYSKKHCLSPVGNHTKPSHSWRHEAPVTRTEQAGEASIRVAIMKETVCRWRLLMNQAGAYFRVLSHWWPPYAMNYVRIQDSEWLPSKHAPGPNWLCEAQQRKTRARLIYAAILIEKPPGRTQYIIIINPVKKSEIETSSNWDHY